MPTIRGLNTSQYLRALAPAKMKEKKSKNGSLISRKKNFLQMSWENLRTFFYRLNLFTFKTVGWANMKKIKLILRSELLTEINSLLHSSKIDTQKIDMITQIFDQLKKRNQNDATLLPIQNLLNQYDQLLKARAQPKKKENETPQPDTPPPPPPSPGNLGPFPLKDEEKLHNLTELLRDEYARNIKKQLIKNPHSNPSFFEKAELFFQKSWEEACVNIQKHHETFQKKYNSKKQVEVSKNEPTLVRTPLFQLQKAIQIVQAEFPHLTSLAYNLEQRAKVARLIQIVLAGPSIASSPLPTTDLCFEIMELAEKSSPLTVFRTNPHQNLVDYQLMTFGAKTPEENLTQCTKQFILDCLTRSGYQIMIDEQVFETSDESKSPYPVMRDLYAQYLIDHPEETKKIAKETCVAFEKLRTFLPNLPEQQKTSALPKSCFDSLIQPFFNDLITENPPSMKKGFQALLEWHKASEFSETQIQAIVKSSGCTPHEIEPLMRKKFIQLSMIFNQSLLAVPHGKITQELDHLIPRTRMIQFAFKDHSFNTLTCHIHNFIVEPEGNPSIKNLFAENLEIASIKTTLDIPSLTSTALPKLTLFSELRQGWLAPFDTYAKLATCIEPDLEKTQPAHQKAVLKEKLDKVVQNFQVLSELSETSELTIEQGELKVVSLKGWFFGGAKQPNFINLDPIKKYFDSFFTTLRNYLDVSQLLDCDTEDFLITINNKKEDVIKGLSKLEDLFDEIASDDAYNLKKFVEDHFNQIDIFS